MSSKAKRLEKKTKFQYPLDYYNDTICTLLLSANVQQKEPYKVKDIKALVKTMEVDFADENWTEQFEKDFGKKVDFNYICAALSRTTGNMIFQPYFAGRVLSLREDGFMPRTVMEGQIITFIQEKEND